MVRHFLSFSGAHEATAKRLAERLNAAGLDVWCSALDGAIPAGADYWDVIQRHLEQCDSFLVLVAAGDLAGGAKAEVVFARDRCEADPAFPMTPLLLPGASYRELPLELRGLQAVKLDRSPDAWSDAELRAFCARLLRQPAAPSAALVGGPRSKWKRNVALGLAVAGGAALAASLFDWNGPKSNAGAPQAAAAIDSGSARGLRPTPSILTLKAIDLEDPVAPGAEVTYQIELLNSGSGAAEHLRLSAELSAELEPTAAAGVTPGRVDGKRVLFAELPTLSPQAKVTWSLRARALGAGSARLLFTVQGSGLAEPLTAQQATEITASGQVAALLLEIVDGEDPIELGTPAAYIIQVTNAGSAAATGVHLLATLPAGLDFVSAGGATSGSALGKSIDFAKLPSLAPRARAEWRVVGRTTAAGDLRFQVVLNSDSTARAIQESEATQVFR